jgi:P-type Ca2+ transporter type 2C
MSTINKCEDDKVYMITKGALDVLLQRCTHIRKSDGVHPLTEEHKKEIEHINKEFSESGLRVLAFAHKEFDEGKESYSRG